MCESDKNRKPNNMILTANSEGGWENPKPGMHQAVCVDEFEMKDQETDYGKKDQIWLVFLLEEKRSDGSPKTITRKYNSTLHVKGTFRKDLRAWRGAELTAVEMEAFDTARLVGAQATLNIQEFQKNDGSPGTQIGAVLPPADGQNVDGSSYKRKNENPDW